MSDNTNLDISILERAVAGFDFVLTDTQKQSFLTYYQLLIEWNSFMNLTAITDFEEVVALDTQYISEWNIGLDIRILLKTVMVVLKEDGSM